MFETTLTEDEFSPIIPEAFENSRVVSEEIWKYIAGNAPIDEDVNWIGLIIDGFDDKSVSKLGGLIPGLLESHAILVQQGIQDGTLFPLIKEESRRMELADRLLRLGTRIPSPESRLEEMKLWLVFEDVFVQVASMLGGDGVEKDLRSLLQQTWKKSKSDFILVETPEGKANAPVPPGYSQADKLKTLFVQLQLHIIRNHNALSMINYLTLPILWKNNFNNQEAALYCLRFVAVPEWKELYELIVDMGFKPSCSKHAVFSTAIVQSVHSSEQVLASRISPSAKKNRETIDWARKTMSELRASMELLEKCLCHTEDPTAASSASPSTAVSLSISKDLKRTWNTYSERVKDMIYLNDITASASSALGDTIAKQGELWEGWVNIKQYLRTFVLGLGLKRKDTLEDWLVQDGIRTDWPPLVVEVQSMTKPQEEHLRGRRLYEKRQAEALANGNLMETTLERRLGLTSNGQSLIKQDDDSIVMN